MRCTVMKKSSGMLLACACLAASTACQRETSNPASSGTANSLTEALPDADINASLEPVGPAPDTSLTMRPRFAGRWAVDEAACASAAWAFSEDGLETPAGSLCRFQDVRAVPDGYDISARCTAEAPERDDRLMIRFRESPERMRFESDSIADADLRACPD